MYDDTSLPSVSSNSSNEGNNYQDNHSSSSSGDSSMTSSQENSSLSQKSDAIEEKKTSENSKESHEMTVFDDLSYKPESGILEFVMRSSQANNYSINYFGKEDLSKQPHSENQKSLDELDRETLHLAILKKKKGRKKLNHKDQEETKAISYLEINSADEEMNEVEVIAFNNLEQYHEGKSCLFSSKIDYTMDGYLIGRVAKIEETIEIATIPPEAFSKLKTSQINKLLDRKYDEQKKFIQNRQSNSLAFQNNLSIYVFILSESDSNLSNAIKYLNDYRDSFDLLEEEKVFIGDVIIDLYQVEVDDIVISKLRHIFTGIKEFTVSRIMIHKLDI